MTRDAASDVPDADLDRLRRQAARDRAARLEAERIAEDSTRALYDHQRRLELVLAAAVAANDAPDTRTALRTALGIVQAHTGWALGHAFVAAPQDLSLIHI